MMSMDDENTPMQEEDEGTQGEGEQIGYAGSSQVEEAPPMNRGKQIILDLKEKGQTLTIEKRNQRNVTLMYPLVIKRR